MLNALSSTSWLQPDLDKPRGSGLSFHLPRLQSSATVTTDPKERSSTKKKAYGKHIDRQEKFLGIAALTVSCVAENRIRANDSVSMAVA